MEPKEVILEMLEDIDYDVSIFSEDTIIHIFENVLHNDTIDCLPMNSEMFNTLLEILLAQENTGFFTEESFYSNTMPTDCHKFEEAICISPYSSDTTDIAFYVSAYLVKCKGWYTEDLGSYEYSFKNEEDYNEFITRGYIE